MRVCNHGSWIPWLEVRERTDRGRGRGGRNLDTQRRGRERMFRLLGGVLSFLKCMCYHSNVVFTTAGGKHRVTEERRGNARHSKMSKIHTLGLSVFTTHKPSRGGKNSFQYKWKKQGVCVFISAFEHFFLMLTTWKYPAEALRRVLLGSQDVILSVAKETLSQRACFPPPWPPSFQPLSVSKKPFCFQPSPVVQSDWGTSLHQAGPGDPNIWGGCIDVSPVSYSEQLLSASLLLAVIVMLVFWYQGVVAACLAQTSTLIYQCYTPDPPHPTPSEPKT